MVSEATVKLHAKGERIVATGEGNGPVNALDNALRLALERLYPELARLELADYKVRILEGSHGTGAVTRVLIESGDGDGAADDMWSTVGVDENIIAASWHALEEAVTYALLRAGHEPGRARGEPGHLTGQPAWRAGRQPGEPCVEAGAGWLIPDLRHGNRPERVDGHGAASRGSGPRGQPAAVVTIQARTKASSRQAL